MLRVFVMFVVLVTVSASTQAKTEPAALEPASKWLQTVASGDPAVLGKTTLGHFKLGSRR
jgi:hypothetical protein